MKKILRGIINAMTIVPIVAYVGYFVLLEDNFLHLSISSIINYSQQLSLRAHFFILGLLPIYVAAVIFGTTLLGYFLAKKIQHFFNA